MFKLSLEKAVLLLIGSVCVLVISLTYPRDGNYSSFGDLRNRVTGTRIWLAGVDPYFFQWKQGMSEEWADIRSDPESEVSRLTVPPSVLVLVSTISHLDYIGVIWIWYVLEWIAMLMIWKIMRNVIVDDKYIWISDLIFLLFVSSFYWIAHSVSGQMYVFYALGLSSVYYLYLKGKVKLSYCLVGMLIVIRPPYVMLLLLLLFKDRFRYLIYSLLVIIVLFGLSILVGGWQSWVNYYDAMKIHSQMPIKAGMSWQGYGDYYPQEIEGITMKFDKIGQHYMRQESSLKGVLQRMKINNFGVETMISVLMVIILMLISYRFIKEKNNLENWFVMAMAWIIGIELIMPSARYAYYDVQLMLPVLLIMKDKFNDWRYWCVLVVGIVGSYFSFFYGTWGAWIWWGIMLIFVGKFNLVTKLFVRSN